MFEKNFKIQLSVNFSFFSTSGTTCYLHCSPETRLTVILLNTSSLLNVQEILSLQKEQCLKYSAFEQQCIRVTVIIWSVAESP